MVQKSNVIQQSTPQAAATQYPLTPAIHFLRENSVAFTPYTFEYEEKGGTAVSSRKLGIPELIVIKTLIMETESKEPLVVLMHGNCQVSLKALARAIGVKKVSPCQPDIANKHSGYVIGGTSPFGTKRKMKIHLEKSIVELERIFINGGAKGFLVSLDPKELIRVLNPVVVEVAIPRES